MCYGQTGAGKTHTMTGTPGGGYSGRGMIPRSIEWLLRYAAIDEREAPANDPRTSSVSWTIRVSALEIYNEYLLDLLDDSVSPEAPRPRTAADAAGAVATSDGLTAAEARRAGLGGPQLAFGRAITVIPETSELGGPRATRAGGDRAGLMSEAET